MLSVAAVHVNAAVVSVIVPLFTPVSGVGEVTSAVVAVSDNTNPLAERLASKPGRLSV